MTLRIGLNGFGRIGRSVYRIVDGRDDMVIVAANDRYSSEQLAYLLQYDTVMGTFESPVEAAEDAIVVGDKTMRLLRDKMPGEVPWGDLGVDLVVEATGKFRTREALLPHIEAGARKVILTVPPQKTSDVDAIVVLGVNDEVLGSKCVLVSNASCTTNCLAPVAKVLDESFGIECGFMTTVHAYTNDQRLADVAHKDKRRARAATQNIIPTTTGAAAAVGNVLPGLQGKLTGLAVRVPVPNGSVVDLVVDLRTDPSEQEVNQAVREAAAGPLQRILEYSEEHLVSSDIIGNPHSSVFDALSTRRIGSRQMRVLAWYDNEWAYSHRVVDLAARMAKSIKKGA